MKNKKKGEEIQTKNFENLEISHVNEFSFNGKKVQVKKEKNTDKKNLNENINKTVEEIKNIKEINKESKSLFSPKIDSFIMRNYYDVMEKRNPEGFVVSYGKHEKKIINLRTVTKYVKYDKPKRRDTLYEIYQKGEKYLSDKKEKEKIENNLDWKNFIKENKKYYESIGKYKSANSKSLIK